MPCHCPAAPPRRKRAPWTFHAARPWYPSRVPPLPRPHPPVGRLRAPCSSFSTASLPCLAGLAQSMGGSIASGRHSLTRLLLRQSLRWMPILILPPSSNSVVLDHPSPLQLRNFAVSLPESTACRLLHPLHCVHRIRRLALHLHCFVHIQYFSCSPPTGGTAVAAGTSALFVQHSTCPCTGTFHSPPFPRSPALPVLEGRSPQPLPAAVGLAFLDYHTTHSLSSGSSSIPRLHSTWIPLTPTQKPLLLRCSRPAVSFLLLCQKQGTNPIFTSKTPRGSFFLSPFNRPLTPGTSRETDQDSHCLPLLDL
ncbi:hypothetical protein B0T22DRAFT_300543 [Podospora appendiculata]|uniref:Uncharacterized protein n=1 Tax=Podospora appendiculata TaxID=314037 RepID=A0AAE0X054_9PEZI|nr:hypothetical protein B0T22DRAFT_300543 [Podospora appendiculata]